MNLTGLHSQPSLPQIKEKATNDSKSLLEGVTSQMLSDPILSGLVVPGKDLPSEAATKRATAFPQLLAVLQGKSPQDAPHVLAKLVDLTGQLEASDSIVGREHAPDDTRLRLKNMRESLLNMSNILDKIVRSGDAYQRALTGAYQ